MTRERVVAILRGFHERQFPRNCSCCGIRFNSFASFIRNTSSKGDPISYDAELQDLRPKEPIGTLILYNCACGTTLSLSSDGMRLPMLARLLMWFWKASRERGIGMRSLMAEIRDEVQEQALKAAADGPPSATRRVDVAGVLAERSRAETE